MQIIGAFFQKFKEKYVRAIFICSNFGPPASGLPPNLRSHCAAHMQIEGFFCYPHRYALLTIRKEPKFYLREYEPRKNSGIRGLSLRTEGAFGNAVFEGLHTPRSALRLFNNHGVETP